jgi:hypothetical protein
MEMIFLQQALGVASEQLPNSVIRSISCTDNALTLSKELMKELNDEAAALYNEEAVTGDSRLPKIHENSLSFGSGVGSSNEGGERNDEDEEEPLPAVALMKALNLASNPSNNLNDPSLVPQSPDEARTIAVSREFQEAIRISNEIFSGLTSSSPHGVGEGNHNGNRSISPFAKSKSEMDLAKLSKLSISPSEKTLEKYNPSDLSQTWAAWVKTLVDYSDRLISTIQPSYDSTESRHTVFLYVRDLIAKTLGTQVFPIGSFVSRTFLPDGDIDATVFIPKLVDDSWFVKLNEALCLAAFQGANNEGITVSNVSFINAEIKMIRSIINGVIVDISTNQLSSCFMDNLIERLDEFIGRNHLFKRSVLLLKAWLSYESPRFTHGGGSLFASTRGGDKNKGLTFIVMLIWTFNSKGKDIYFPIQALSYFFRMFNSFDWSNSVLTVVGPVPIDTVISYAPPNGSDKMSLTSSSSSSLSFFNEFNNSNNFLPLSVFDFTIPDDPKFSKPTTKRERSDTSMSSATNDGAPSISPVPSGEDDTSVSGMLSPFSPSSQVNCSNESITAIKKEFKQGLMNILDPFDIQRNLFEDIDSSGYELFISTFRKGYMSFQCLCEESSKLLGFGQFSTQQIIDDIEKLIKSFFLNATQKFPFSNDALADLNTDEGRNHNFDCYQINKDDLQVKDLDCFTVSSCGPFY